MSHVELLKELRDSTGLSFNEIKKALDESGGDKARALEVLKAHGVKVAEKKALRTTGQGLVEAYIHSNKKVGVLLELLCETDFVARNPMFSELAHEVAMQVAAMDPQDGPELLSQPYIRDQDVTVEELITQYIAKLGENIKIGKFCRLQL
ncbi:MAG: elongation factor Ts [Candidatus Yanofskybacteria bacterium]|nr:elongation factor Ts [Candidatus Yanofskybacteria bacterium]